MSPFALQGLIERGVTAASATRSPRQCTAIDLQNADHIVALDETEHRPLMRERFSEWEHRVQYWSIGDVEFVEPNHAFSLIDAQIDELLNALSEIEAPSANLPPDESG